MAEPIPAVLIEAAKRRGFPGPDQAEWIRVGDKDILTWVERCTSSNCGSQRERQPQIVPPKAEGRMNRLEGIDDELWVNRFSLGRCERCGAVMWANNWVLKPDVEQFVENIRHLVIVANRRARQHPQILSVTWSPVAYKEIPDSVRFWIHYVPDGGQVLAPDFLVNASIITNRDEEAFLAACQRITE